MQRIGIPATVMAAALVLLAGCGSGSGGNAAARSTTVSASINAAQGARRAQQLVQGSLSALNGLNAAGRQIGTGDLTFVDALGLYVRTRTSLTGIRADFFTDAEGRHPAGHAEARPRGSLTRFPLTVALTYEATAGAVPGTGAFSVVLNDAGAQSGSLSGSVGDRVTGLTTQVDLSYADAGVAGMGTQLTGSLMVKDDDGDVTFRDLAPDTVGSGGFSATLAFGAIPGAIRQDADGSGSLTFNDSAGPVRARWDVSGAGTVTRADGSVRVVSDFDTEP